MTYRLICDSCTDLPSELGADPHVKKVPQIGRASCRERV